MGGNVIAALNMLWQGMFGLFVVMALIAGVVALLGKRDKNNQDKPEA